MTVRLSILPGTTPRTLRMRDATLFFVVSTCAYSRRGGVSGDFEPRGDDDNMGISRHQTAKGQETHPLREQELKKRI